MFGLYALPTDDVAGQATVTASAPDTGYPAQNIVAPTNTGHLNLPSRPGKLTDTSGWFHLLFPSAVTVVAVAVIYHDFVEDLDVSLDIGTGSPFTNSIPIPIPAKPNAADDWTLSPWVRFAAQTSDNFRLSINGTNDRNVQVGRLLLLTTLRQLETDVRYGGEDQEERIVIADPTELGVETMYDLYNVQRRFEGEFGFRPDETSALLQLWRSARNRVLPWLLIDDETVNDAKLVRFEDNAYSRTHQTIGFNSHPFNVREVSRGLPWP